MNKEKLMGYWAKVKEALGKVSKKIWILIAAVLVVLVAGVVIFINTRPYAPLIDGATAEEAGTVITWLESQGVTNYRMEGTGTVLVPEDQAVSLKAKLLQEQYSSANSPYSGYFEKVSALSTMKDREVAQLDVLAARLESVIRKFDNVRDVSVDFQTGEDRAYILDTNNVVNASAGVLLTMENGKLLTTEQANAIRNYVSHSVAALDVENVSIQDTKGNIYDGLGSGGSSAADSSALVMQLEQYWSNAIRSRLERILEPMYGEGHVYVSVNCTVELGDKTVNDYDVHLPGFAEDGSTNGAGIIGNRFYAYQIVNGDETTAGGVVGTSTNAQIPDYVESGEPQNQLQNILEGQGSTEYDNSKTQTYMVVNAGTLTDVYVGLSIDSTTAGPVNVNDVREFVAATAGIIPNIEMTDDMTMEQYEIRKAEYLSQKVGVLNGPFYVPPELPPEPTWIDSLEAMGIPAWVVFAAIGGLVLFLVVLLTVILLVRRSKKKKQEAEKKAIDALMATALPGQTVIIDEDGKPILVTMDENGQPVPVLASPEVELDENGNPVTGADVMDLHTERSMELRQSIREFVDENMDVAALLIKSWMKEGGDNG